MLRKFVRTSPVLEVWIGGRCIETTSEHPFFVVGRAVQQPGEENLSGWLPAAWLRAGDLLISHEGKYSTVEKVADTGRVTTVYNLQVEDAHTYFVGSQEWGFSVWAHNAGPECGGKGPEGLSGEAKKNYDADQDTFGQKNAPSTIPANVQQAAQRLGVDLNAVQIENGVLRTRIRYLTDTNAMGADVQTLVNYARQQGARTAVIDTGVIQHPILSDWAADPARVSSMLGRPAQVRVLEEVTLPFPVSRHGRVVSTTSTYRRVEITVPLE